MVIEKTYEILKALSIHPVLLSEYRTLIYQLLLKVLPVESGT